LSVFIEIRQKERKKLEKPNQCGRKKIANRDQLGMQGFRNFGTETMQREHFHIVDMMPPQYGKSTPPMSPNSGKFEVLHCLRPDSQTSSE
jgi:hypothetical protein